MYVPTSSPCSSGGAEAGSAFGAEGKDSGAASICTAAAGACVSLQNCSGSHELGTSNMTFRGRYAHALCFALAGALCPLHGGLQGAKCLHGVCVGLSQACGVQLPICTGTAHLHHLCHAPPDTALPPLELPAWPSSSSNTRIWSDMPLRILLLPQAPMEPQSRGSALALPVRLLFGNVL